VAAYQGPFPATVSGTFSEILVSSAVFSGGVTNIGVVSGAGVVVVSSTFQSGGFVNKNFISGSQTGIGVSASTIQGAIVDSGVILAANAGILVNTPF